MALNKPVLDLELLPWKPSPGLFVPQENGAFYDEGARLPLLLLPGDGSTCQEVYEGKPTPTTPHTH